MNKRAKNILVILLAVLLIIIFTPIFGGWYKNFFGPACTGFLCPNHPEYLDGFLFSCMFFISLILTLFGGAKKYKNMFVLLGILVLFDLFLGAWEGLIISLGAALIGWFLAQVGLAIFRGLKIKI